MIARTTTALLTMFGLIAGGTAWLTRAQAPKPDVNPAPAQGKAAPELGPDQMLTVLARARIEAAQKVRDDMYRLFQGGEVNLTKYLEAQARYNDAILSVATDPAERIKILRDQLAVMNRLAQVTRDLYRKNQVTRADAELAEFHRLGAALQLVEAQSGHKARLKTSAPGEKVDPATLQAILDRLSAAPKKE